MLSLSLVYYHRHGFSTLFAHQLDNFDQCYEDSNERSLLCSNSEPHRPEYCNKRHLSNHKSETGRYIDTCPPITRIFIHTRRYVQELRHIGLTCLTVLLWVGSQHWYDRPVKGAEHNGCMQVSWSDMKGCGSRPPISMRQCNASRALLIGTLCPCINYFLTS